MTNTTVALLDALTLTSQATLRHLQVAKAEAELAGDRALEEELRTRFARLTDRRSAIESAKAMAAQRPDLSGANRLLIAIVADADAALSKVETVEDLLEHATELSDTLGRLADIVK